MWNSVKFIIILVIAIIGVQGWGVLPWWSYLIVTCLIGMILTPKQTLIKPFWAGFFAGAIVWVGGNLFYSWYYSGGLLEKMADNMFGSISILYVVIAIIGGILTGLSVHAGALVKKGKDVLELKIED